MELRIAHLYPDLLNLYGDRGNLIALKRRCQWRGIGCTVESVGIGDPFLPDRYDLVFIGGGQDFEQNLLHDDLVDGKGPLIRRAVEADMVFLCICGGYQMMGHYYEEQNGDRISCIGALDLYTKARSDRLTGDLVCRSDEFFALGLDPLLIGFENHSGRTFLGSSAKPLATVLHGHGNNGRDGTEGARYRNVFATYSHGSFLPKNPAVADELIERALRRNNPSFEGLPKLPDYYEQCARQDILMHLKRFDNQRKVGVK